MSKMVNGYGEMHTILMNERKLGGVIEAESIKLRSGEEFLKPVITNIDFSGSLFYSLSFVDRDGRRMMVHVNDISIIDSPTHINIYESENTYYRNLKIEEKLNYLRRLCEVNEGSCTELFYNEVKKLVKDIGESNISNDLDLSFLNENKKVYKIA